ncbi:MAG: hypothetical protein V4583_06000 [Pseudomonadota bacterium]
MIFAFLPLADVKTIRLPVPETAQSSNLAAEIAVAVALLGLLGFIFLLQHLWRAARPRAKPARAKLSRPRPTSATRPRAKPATEKRPPPKPLAESWVLIDGSNVMHWQDNAPRLEAVRKVVDLVRARGYVPGVVFDANAGWKLAGRYLHDGDFAQLLGLEARQVLVVAKGTQADPFLLQTAREFGARIVSNDRFRDWMADHPEIQTPGFLIRGRDVGGEIALEGLAAKPGAVPVNKR